MCLGKRVQPFLFRKIHVEYNVKQKRRFVLLYVCNVTYIYTMQVTIFIKIHTEVTIGYTQTHTHTYIYNLDV